MGSYRSESPRAQLPNLDGTSRSTVCQKTSNFLSGGGFEKVNIKDIEIVFKWLFDGREACSSCNINLKIKDVGNDSKDMC